MVAWGFSRIFFLLLWAPATSLTAPPPPLPPPFTIWARARVWVRAASLGPLATFLAHEACLAPAVAHEVAEVLRPPAARDGREGAPGSGAEPGGGGATWPTAAEVAVASEAAAGAALKAAAGASGRGLTDPLNLVFFSLTVRTRGCGC